MNFKNIKYTLVFILIMAAISWLVYTNLTEEKAEPNDEIKDELLSLTALNDSTLLVLLETKKLIAEKDEKIKALEEQIAKTNAKVIYLKSKRDEKVNSIKSILPDSLYKLLSGLKY